MSKTVEQRVVEMRFDNKQFEQGTRQTMSTLEKLKAKLNLSGATKGLEELNVSSKNTHNTFKELEYNACQAGFSLRDVWLKTSQVFEYQIARNIISSAKNIVSALTIDPIKTGFQEYETKMGSIQTILANTEHQGTTMDDVTRALEELNLYADKTIYNFQEMTRNIGTFTAAGVNLDTSVASIKGIANLAAVSGSNAQQASTAMYQLSQALATGVIRVQDWNSVVNAGMGGKVFQNALIRTAAMLDGQAKSIEAWQKKNVDAYGSFRESLTKGEWLTTEVLTETLNQFTMAAEKGSEEWKKFKKELMDKGYAEEQAEAILKMANTATDAATKVKTFTQLFDTLKESAQSGWAQTWELIFGDFEEAKDFFTGLSDMIGGFIGDMSDFRNSILKKSMSSNWDILMSKIMDAGKKTTDYEEAIMDLLKAQGKSSDEIDEMISEYGSLQKAIKKGVISTDILKKALSKLGISTGESNKKLAGFVEGLEKIEKILHRGSIGDDVKSLQTALNELGYDLGEPGIDGIIGPITQAAIKNFQKEAGVAVDGIAGPETLAALKKAGSSVEKISEEVKEAGLSYDELIDNITKKGGRELFLEGFSNVINGLVGVLKSIGAAWADIFPAEETSKGLLGVLEKFSKLTKSFRLYEEVVNESGETVTVFNENGKKLVRTFKGILAILDLVTSVFAGGFRLAFTIVKAILNAFGMDVLDMTASIGDAIVKVSDWIEKNNFLADGIEFIAKYVKIVVDAIREWVKNNEVIQQSIKNLKDSLFGLGGGLKKWLEGLKETDNLPKYIIDGLAKGLMNGIKFIFQVAVELGKCIIEAIKGVLRIKSPSREMYEIGEYIIEGLVNGLEAGLRLLVTFVKMLGEKLVQLFNEINLGHVISVAFKTGIIILIKDFLSILNELSKPISSINDILKETGRTIKKVGDMFTRFGKGFEDIGKSFKRRATGDAIKSTAIAIGILAASIYLLTKADQDKLWSAVGVLAALGVIVASLGVAINYIAKSKAKGFTRTALSLIIIAIALAMLTSTMKKIAKIKPDEMVTVIEGMIVMVATLGSLLLITSKLDVSAKSVLTLIPLVLTLAMMSSVIKKLAKLDPESVIASAISLGILLAAMSGVLFLLSKMSLNIKDAGIGVLALTAMAVPLLAFVGVLALMQNVENATSNVTALTKLATALSLLLLPLSLVGALAAATSGLTLLGIVALAAMAIPLLAFVGVLAIMQNIDGAAENAKLLTDLMIIMSDVLIKISLLAPLAMMGVTSMGALTLLIAAVGAFAVGIGALTKHFPSLEEFLDSGLSIMIRIADGMGQMVGAFVKGALTQISNALPAIGLNLSMFMINLTPFIVGAKMIDNKVVSGVKSLAETILLITGSSLLESLTSWLTGKDSIAEFGSQLGLLGLGLKGFVTSLGTFNESQIATITAACNALRAIAQVADAIPNEGGLWSLVAGDNKLTNFAEQMPKLGEGLSGFISKLGVFDASKIPIIDAACQALKSLSDAANAIPNQGGLWGLIAGDNKLDEFAKQMPKLGEGLSGFISKLGVFDASKIPVIDAACQALKAISDAAGAIPNEGGLWGLIAGENKLDEFAKQIPKLGEGLSGFMSKIGSFDASKIPVIEAACTAINSFATLGKIDLKSASEHLGDFSDSLVEFSKEISTFITNTGKIDSAKIDSSISKINDLIEMAKNAADTNTGSLKTFGDSLIKIAREGVTGFIKEFSGSTPKADAEKAAKNLVKAAVDGADDKKSDIKKKAKDISEAFTDELCTKSLKDDAKTAGKDLVIGFANGITDNKWRVTDAGTAIGKEALKAAKKAIDSNSPSKEAMKIGNYFGQGLVIGIEDYESKSYNAGFGVADYARKGLSKAVSKISNIINSDIDAQPTIRPVLDLSDVESGAGYLNSMFNNSPAIGLTSNIRAISSSMDARNQNGSNSDVVTAIDKLRKDLGNVGGTTYNVNGVTYDDGSNITEAVRTIVRAAKVERRI